MKRITLLAAAALLVLSALPASAQYGTAPTGQQQRPPVSEGQTDTTTPCSTIVITPGENNVWGPETTVFIDRNFNGANCPGTGNTNDVLENTDEDGGNTFAARTADGRESVQTDQNGNFIARIQVPADAVDTYEVTLSGTDFSGQAKNQALTYQVVAASSFVPETATDAGSNSAMIAIVALLAAGLLAFGFNWSSVVGKIRR